MRRFVGALLAYAGLAALGHRAGALVLAISTAVGAAGAWLTLLQLGLVDVAQMLHQRTAPLLWKKFSVHAPGLIRWTSRTVTFVQRTQRTRNGRTR